MHETHMKKFTTAESTVSNPLTQKDHEECNALQSSKFSNFNIENYAKNFESQMKYFPLSY